MTLILAYTTHLRTTQHNTKPKLTITTEMRSTFTLCSKELFNSSRYTALLLAEILARLRQGWLSK